MSDFGLTGFRENCSGDMYDGVPHSPPSSVSVR